MEKMIGTFSMLICICLPLILFYSRTGWIKENSKWKLFIVLLPIFSYLTYAFCHELCHYIGTLLVGREIIDYQLIPRFWKGDFSTAYIEHDGGTDFQNLIITISPYIRDLIFIPIGFYILRSKRISNAFIVGLLFMFFILSSLSNTFTNFVAYALYQKGDFNKISELIGEFWALFIGGGIIIYALIFILRVNRLYSGFAKTQK